MLKILVLLLTTASCTLKILSPPELVNLYSGGIIPSIANIGQVTPVERVISASGSALFLPDSKLCSKNYIGGYINIILWNKTCELSPKLAKSSNVIGIVSVLNANNSDLGNYILQADENGSMFIAGISNQHIDLWKPYSGNIILSFEPDIQLETPVITLVLTGVHSKDKSFLDKLYRSLIPIKENEVVIELLFDYYSCENCSINNCYCDGDYCLDGSSPKGKDMVNRSLYEIVLFDRVIQGGGYLGDIIMFLHMVAHYCYDDYSDSCHNEVLNWLGIDPQRIKSVVDSSWNAIKDDTFGCNSLINSQISRLKDKSIKSAPMVMVNDKMFFEANLTGFLSEICKTMEYSVPLCTGMCSSSCYLKQINDNHCDSMCQAESCEYDNEDCRKFRNETEPDPDPGSGSGSNPGSGSDSNPGSGSGSDPGSGSGSDPGSGSGSSSGSGSTTNINVISITVPTVSIFGLVVFFVIMLWRCINKKKKKSSQDQVAPQNEESRQNLERSLHPIIGVDLRPKLQMDNWFDGINSQNALETISKCV